jgi:hypothetical protein
METLQSQRVLGKGKSSSTWWQKCPVIIASSERFEGLAESKSYVAGGPLPKA